MKPFALAIFSREAEVSKDYEWRECKLIDGESHHIALFKHMKEFHKYLHADISGTQKKVGLLIHPEGNPAQHAAVLLSDIATENYDYFSRRIYLTLFLEFDFPGRKTAIDLLIKYLYDESFFHRFNECLKKIKGGLSEIENILVREIIDKNCYIKTSIEENLRGDFVKDLLKYSDEKINEGCSAKPIARFTTGRVSKERDIKARNYFGKIVKEKWSDNIDILSNFGNQDESLIRGQKYKELYHPNTKVGEKLSEKGKKTFAAITGYLKGVNEKRK